MSSSFPIGIVTVSDRASRGDYEDKGGPGIIAALTDLLASPWRPVSIIIPDEKPTIMAALADLADRVAVDLHFQQGGNVVGRLLGMGQRRRAERQRHRAGATQQLGALKAL